MVRSEFLALRPVSCTIELPVGIADLLGSTGHRIYSLSLSTLICFVVHIHCLLLMMLLELSLVHVFSIDNGVVVCGSNCSGSDLLRWL